MRFTFRPFERLHRDADFLSVRRHGRKRTGRHLVLYVSRHTSDPGTPSRLGLMVGRRFGNAVRRNRIKRQIREIFRLNKHQFPYTMDIVAIPLPAGKAPSTEIIREEFLRLIGAAPVEGMEGKGR